MEKQHRNLIDGNWVGTEFSPNLSPSDESDVVGQYARGSAADAHAAIAAAKSAFPTWSRTGPLERHAILRRTSDEILLRKDELGRLLSREEGKTLAEGIGEAIRAAQIFDFFAAETMRIAGESIASVRPGVGVEVTREPMGVVGIIAPWNFPIAIPAWKIAPALCYGNTIVLKPADLVPGSAWAIVDILHRAGLPAGVLNLVMGKGSVVGQAMLDSTDIAAISFTGSTATGQRVALASIKHNRKFQLEMGSKNPLVVLDDAELNTAVECAINGAFFSTGQRCTASSRLIVTEGIHDRFVAAPIERLGTLNVDHALEKAYPFDSGRYSILKPCRTAAGVRTRCEEGMLVQCCRGAARTLLARSGAMLDNVSIGGGRETDTDSDKPVECHSQMAAAVPPEDKLVEVALDVLLAKSVEHALCPSLEV